MEKIFETEEERVERVHDLVQGATDKLSIATEDMLRAAANLTERTPRRVDVQIMREALERAFVELASIERGLGDAIDGWPTPSWEEAGLFEPGER